MKKKNKLCVQLTGKDLADMGFTFESIDGVDGNSHRFVKTVEDKIIGELGMDFFVYSQNTVIEAMPASQGGCILFFTFNECNSVICSFKNLDCIYPLIYNIYNEKEITASGLYLKDGEYKMVFVFKSELDEKTVNLLCEFADISLNSEKNSDFPGWKTLAYPDAMEKLVKYNN